MDSADNSMTKTSILSIEQLGVRLGRSKILDELNLTVELDGQVVGLFGPNGAGKSTLMRAIVGLINDYSGSISIPPSKCSYLPDSPLLYPFLKLSDCVELYESLFSDFSSEAAASMFEKLELPLNRTVGQCSKGMSEQLHLVLALARRVNLYVLDEPLAAVDPLTRDVMMELISDYRAPDSTVLLSTHLINGLETLFDDVAFISRGRIILQDSVSSVCHDGKTLENVFKEVMREQALAR